MNNADWLRDLNYIDFLRDVGALFSVNRMLTAECYKRPPKCDDPRLEGYFAWRRQIACIREEPISPEIFGPELGKRAGEMLEKLIPLYDYFNMICGNSKCLYNVTNYYIRNIMIGSQIYLCTNRPF